MEKEMFIEQIILFSLVLILSFFCTWIVKEVAVKKKIVDIPNQRSSHTIPTPRGGGLAIVIIWYLALTYLFITQKIESSLFYALLPGLLLVIIGILDDIINLSPKIRMLFQILSAGLALFFLKGLQILDIGFFQIEWVILLSIPAFVGIIWVINLFNFLDGIDGYISVEVISLCLALFFFVQDTIFLVLVFAVLGFLFWNWQKAKIFMGDVGSTLLGFNIAVFAIYYQNTEEISIVPVLILTAAFWFDASYTLFRRWINKEKLSEAHKKHAYQRLVQSGFSHQKTTLSLLAINLILFGLAWVANKYNTYNLLLLLATIVFLFFINWLIDKRKAFE